MTRQLLHPGTSPIPSLGSIRTRYQLPHSAGFWVIAATFLAAMAFTTVPTPLYAIYQHREGFATVIVTVIFAAYALGVMVSLYFVGHLSDRFGRRRLVLISILLEVVAALIFVVVPEVPLLVLARFISGVGIGTLTATATAHLAELRSIARPTEYPGVASTVSTVVNTGGLAVGPIVAGCLAQYVFNPLVVPYALFLVLLAALALAVVFVPETVDSTQPRPAYRPQHLTLPDGTRAHFISATVAASSGFAAFGMFTALAPSFLAGILHEHAPIISGATVFGVFASSALAQVALARISTRHQLVTGVVLTILGLTAVGLAVLVVGLVVFISGGIVAGAGVGLLFRSAVAGAAALSSPEHKGEVLAALFLAAYAGLVIPVIALGPRWLSHQHCRSCWYSSLLCCCLSLSPACRCCAGCSTLQCRS